MKLATFGLASALALAQAPPGTGAAVQVRFHHLHLRTDDPAAAMTAVINRTGGTRVILQGLGVGVRIGDQYVLFDRVSDAVGSESSRLPGDGRGVQAAYPAVVRWLQARKFDVSPPEFGATRVSPVALEGVVDHVAFATPDLVAAVAALQRAGDAPLRQTGESVMVVADGTPVEIVRDTDRPDAFWCPMHPEVRSSTRTRCPFCSMGLVPIPPPALGHYRLDVSQIPNAAGTGVRALQIAIRHPATSDRVTNLMEVHERLLHLFVVRRDLSFFAHVHPERSADGFEVPIDLAPGAYLVVADFVPSGGAPQLVQHAIVTPGYNGSPFAIARLEPDVSDKTTDGLRISLAPGPRVGKESLLRFTVRDAASGGLVTDLEPYLGAAGHLLVVSADVAHAIHAHPEGAAATPGRSGEVVFAPVLPAPGIYKLWVQFQRNGRVVTAPFAVEVRD